MQFSFQHEKALIRETCEFEPRAISELLGVPECQCLGVLVHLADMADEKFQLLGLIKAPKVFGLTPCDVLKWPAERDLDVVELWAGKESVANAGRSLNLEVAAFDILRKPEEDITSLSGFRLALALVLRVRRFGLLHMAPVCSSFGFMNSSRCQRDEANRFAGDLSYEKVHEGNLMADIAAFFLFVGWARDVHCSIENPIGSTIFKYGGVAVAVDKLELVESLVYRCSYDEAPMGERYLKGFRFLATSAWIDNIRRPCECEPRCHSPTVTKLDLGAVRGIDSICLLADFLCEVATMWPSSFWICNTFAAIHGDVTFEQTDGDRHLRELDRVRLVSPSAWEGHRRRLACDRRKEEGRSEAKKEDEGAGGGQGEV